MKFQPTPSSASATRKWATVMPLSATATHAAIEHDAGQDHVEHAEAPDQRPGDEAGRVHADDVPLDHQRRGAKGWLQKLIAIGVAVISRFMRP